MHRPDRAVPAAPAATSAPRPRLSSRHRARLPNHRACHTLMPPLGRARHLHAVTDLGRGRSPCHRARGRARDRRPRSTAKAAVAEHANPIHGDTTLPVNPTAACAAHRGRGRSRRQRPHPLTESDSGPAGQPVGGAPLAREMETGRLASSVRLVGDGLTADGRRRKNRTPPFRVGTLGAIRGGWTWAGPSWRLLFSRLALPGSS
jgi:hypothetical protein